jgi:hypothetical protein
MNQWLRSNKFEDCSCMPLLLSVWLEVRWVPTGARGQERNPDEEVQTGQEVNELKVKGEIIESSPLYDQLKPIADLIRGMVLHHEF